jgi:hypothetical protein
MASWAKKCAPYSHWMGWVYRPAAIVYTVFSFVVGCHCEIPILTLHPDIFTTGTIKYGFVHYEILATTLQMI